MSCTKESDSLFYRTSSNVVYIRAENNGQCPAMLTGHIQQSHRNKRKFPRSSVVCDELNIHIVEL